MTSPLSRGTAAARNLATTTKSVPQAAAINPRWLLRMLPWVHVDSATYRLNRRRSYRLDDGRVAFVAGGDGRLGVVARELVLRTGQEHQGVIGLRRAGVPDVSVRFAGVGTRGVASYLLSTYYSVAVPVPDALGVLENVEIGLPMEEK
jgi:hypothetical protein